MSDPTPLPGTGRDLRAEITALLQAEILGHGTPTSRSLGRVADFLVAALHLDDLTAELAEAKADAIRNREAFDSACSTVVAMHKAAVGEIRGPKRGVVEDIADLAEEAARVTADRDRLRAALDAANLQIRGLLNPTTSVGRIEGIFDIHGTLPSPTSTTLYGPGGNSVPTGPADTPQATPPHDDAQAKVQTGTDMQEPLPARHPLLAYAVDEDDLAIINRMPWPPADEETSNG